MSGDLKDPEASIVKHLAQLVKCIKAYGVIAFASPPVVKHYRSLDPEPASEKVEDHLVHTNATIALEPDRARLARSDVVAIGDIYE